MVSARALPDDIAKMVELMIYGMDEARTIDGRLRIAGYPLTLIEAAIVVGVRRRRARHLSESPVFQAKLARGLRSVQRSERARNLVTAVRLRDDEGERSPAHDLARLKAIALIESLK